MHWLCMLPSTIGVATAAAIMHAPRGEIPQQSNDTASALMTLAPPPDDCTLFDVAYSEADNCDMIASLWGIPIEEFIAWNPEVGPDCSKIQVGQEYCVERNWGLPPPPPPTSTGVAPPEPTSVFPSPFQEGIINSCVDFYFAAKGDTCAKIIQKYGTFTLEEFISWNPAVGEDCAGLWASTYYCVGVPGTPTTRPTTAAPTTTGQPKPSPTQDGMIETCNKFYKAVKGDTCNIIVARHSPLTLPLFIKWNPAVEADCTGLWADTYYCVGAPGQPAATTTQASSKPTTTTAPGGIATPTPWQPGMVSNCDRFYFVKSGENCQTIAARHGITQAQLYQWNPSVGSDCRDLWANAYVCVRTVGFQPPARLSCPSTGKTWGGNKPATLQNVIAWCDGKDRTDGSGGFSTGQTKRGCFNAPLGNNKIEFELRNDFGIGKALSIEQCKEIVRKAVDRCDRGGVGSIESWYVRAGVVAGTC